MADIESTTKAGVRTDMKARLGDILMALSWREIARNYFGKSSSWLYHKLDGIDGNGGVAGMNYHHFLTEGKGKEKYRIPQGNRQKNHQKHDISPFFCPESVNICLSPSSMEQYVPPSGTKRAPDAHAPEAPESFDI